MPKSSTTHCAMNACSAVASYCLFNHTANNAQKEAEAKKKKELPQCLCKDTHTQTPALTEAASLRTHTNTCS